MTKENLSTQICRYDGKNCFVEVVTNAFQIGKVLFIFLQYDPDTNCERIRLEIYLDFSDALAFARMIINNRLMMIMSDAEREGIFAGKEVNAYTSYFTIMSGSIISKNSQRKRYDKVKKMFPELLDFNGELVINKQFKIQKSNKNYIMIRGEYINGERIGKGLIVPKGKAIAGITISLSEVQALGMAEQIRVSIEAYKTQFFMKYSDLLFPNQNCLVYQHGDNDSQTQPSLARGDNKKIDITLCSDLVEINEELLYIKATFHGQAFVLYIMKSRLHREDMYSGNQVSINYEIIEKNGKKLCYFIS